MTPLAQTSARVLEFESLLEILHGYASSPLGHARIHELVPSADRGWIESQHQLTSEIREFRRVGGRFEFTGLLDISSSLAKSRITGAVLEIEEIRNVIVVVDRAKEWHAIIHNPPAAMRSEWKAVNQLSSSIPDFSDFLRSFHNKILPDGTLDDHASPELSRGVVHGASSSGQTVYVEPLETIEQNNELVRLLEEEIAEVHRILGEMTSRIGKEAPAIKAAQDILAELDLQFAKARFAEDYNCVAVTLAEDIPAPDPDPAAERRKIAAQGEGQVFRPSPWVKTQIEQAPEGRKDTRLLLHKARHPLLERNLKTKGATPVPISLELEGPRRELIITGPNTGGKTVSLKTVGLLALMAQSGIPVPADRADMPIFDAVLADIGDSQSIEQNLSTFSAHVTNIDLISRTATPQSLVLLDELGSATDPEEGAALAVAIAGHFHQIGCMTIISTHHTSLKVYGANTAGVINASVGFNESTLQPTYELKIGIPGASAGINIAQRLGLNPTIIQTARDRIGTQARDVGEFLDRLHAQLREADSERLKLKTREEELSKEKAQLAAEGRKEQQAKVKELEKKLDTLLRDFEYHAREAVSAIQDRAAAQKLSKEAERRIAKLRREFSQQFDATVVAHSTGADKGDPNAQPQIVKHVSEGDTVKLKSVGKPARVSRRLDENHFEVEVGVMKMRIHREDIAEVITRVSDSPVKAARARGISVSLQTENENVPSEINVIGRTVDDATQEVEKFVDRAFLAGLPRVRVVHGSGMGILRKALRQFLQKHPHVESVAEPPQNEGGGGATVVELRT